MNKEKIIIPVATIIALVCLVYMDKIWAAISWNAEIFIAISAIASVAIAVIALSVSMRADKRNEKQARLSVEPLLKIITYDTLDKEDSINKNNNSIMKHRFVLTNYGIGPAIIKDVKLLLNDEEIAHNHSKDFYDALRRQLKKFEFISINCLIPSDVMKVDEERPLWTVKYNVHTQDVNVLQNLHLRITYQSIYKDKDVVYDTRDDHKFHSKESFVSHTPSHIAVAKEMARIHSACFSTPRPWTAQEFAELIQDPRVFYIMYIHGFILGQQLDESNVELLTLAVAPEHQNKGHGGALLYDFITKVRDMSMDSISLEVAETNEPAIHLYLSMGFQEIGVRPDYYTPQNEPPIDAVQMRLDIKKSLPSGAGC